MLSDKLEGVIWKWIDDSNMYDVGNTTTLAKAILSAFREEVESIKKDDNSPKSYGHSNWIYNQFGDDLLKRMESVG